MVLFSIVIPVYNTEKYLDYCLQSILKQSYSSYEIILVDDGSKDNSGRIVLSLVETRKNILIYFLLFIRKIKGSFYPEQLESKLLQENLFFV